MWQTFYIVIIIAAALSCFVYYKVKIGPFKNQVEIFLLFGLAITIIGSFLVYIFFGRQVLLDSLVLKFENLAGRFILIGYSLILSAVLFEIERLFMLFITFIKGSNRKGTEGK